ncbi:MAG TPA: SDR family oxidoreductase, partial [Woeseiaceae bacterium]
MLTLEGQTILITGASRGIGAATAAVALDAGASIIGSFRSGAGILDKLSKQYGPERVRSIKADLALPGAGGALWRQALDQADGVIHGLVNNAGIAPATPLEADDDTWQRDWSEVLAVNTRAVADLCREAVLYFGPRGGGRIVNVA